MPGHDAKGGNPQTTADAIRAKISSKRSYAVVAAGHAASSALKLAMKASGWSIIT